MSILLDAVIHNKQQGELPDPASAPMTSQASEQTRSVKTIVLITLGLLAGGAAALAVNHWISGQNVAPNNNVAAVDPSVQELAQPNQAAKMMTEVSHVSQPEAKSATDTINASVTATDTVASEIRLAGRGTLPLAQPRPLNTATRPSVTEAVSHTIEANKTANDRVEDQPLILGANTNLTPEQLAILRREMGTEPEGMGDLVAEVQQQEQALMSAFEQALKDVEYHHSVNHGVTPKALDPIPEPEDNGLPKYGDLPQTLQQQVPDFNIVAHVYATTPDKRWLNVDGRELQQGDEIAGKLKIVEIRPRDVVLAIAGTEFVVPAI